jgi:hypothetical protein
MEYNSISQCEYRISSAGSSGHAVSNILNESYSGRQSYSHPPEYKMRQHAFIGDYSSHGSGIGPAMAIL